MMGIFLVRILKALFVVVVLIALVYASVFCGSMYPWCCALVLDFLSYLSWFGGLLEPSSCDLVGVMLRFGGSLILGHLLALFVILSFCVLVLGLLLWWCHVWWRLPHIETARFGLVGVDCVYLVFFVCSCVFSSFSFVLSCFCVFGFIMFAHLLRGESWTHLNYRKKKCKNVTNVNSNNFFIIY